MKKFFNKKSIMIASLLLVFSLGVGSTLSYVFTKTDPIDNIFASSKVSCAVVTNGASPVTGGTTVVNASDLNVQIKNTGDTEAYIRVAVVVNWTTEDGEKVWASAPKLLEDYSISITDGDVLGNWDISDFSRYGIIYYKHPVEAGEMTSALPAITALKTNPGETDGTAYCLSVEIVASAIQSTPEGTVAQMWGVTVGDDHSISKSNGG